MCFNVLYLCVFEVFFVFFAQIFCERILINYLHKKHVEQVTKKYGPTWQEKEKLGTPSMGGITFPIVMCLPIMLNCYLASEKLLVDFIALFLYPLFVALIGFYDDWLKNVKHSSEGLRSLQKLFLQVVITAVTVFFALKWQTPNFLGLKIPMWLYALILVFLGVGLQNAVNVTDGLDGLASGLSLFSFLALAVILSYNNLLMLISFSACALCLGFLWHNAKPATIFMGDTGAHFLAGLIFAVCLVANRMFLVVPVSFLFGIEILSVSIQIFTIRMFNKRVFRMSPIHHHFELLGYSETKIVSRFYILHIIGIILLYLLLKSTI